jgi:hypothetical protein
MSAPAETSRLAMMASRAAGSTWPAHRSFLVAIVALFLCRAVAADAVIPPWQGPDEPTHFALTKLVSLGGDAASARPALEARILASMARHGWWAAYQEPTPDPLPRTFPEVPGHLADNVSRGTMSQPAYYLAGAAALRLAPGLELEHEYRLLRLLSLVMSAGALLCGWAGTRVLFGEATAAAAVSVAALHPQFLVSALSVNPDALINLCGAVMWWQAARLVADAPGGLRLVRLGAIGGAALVAAASKRNGGPLVAIALLLAAAECVRAFRAMRREHAVALCAGAVVAFAAAASATWRMFPEQMAALENFWSGGVVVRRSPAAMLSVQGYDFLQTAVDSSWLIAGWLRFRAPEWWLWTVRVLTAAALLGAVWALVRRSAGPQRLVRPLAFTCIFTGLHIAPLLVVAFVLVSVPQGRYLFAVMLPLSALLVVGVQQWFPEHRQPMAAVLLVSLVAALDAVALIPVLVRAYT